MKCPDLLVDGTVNLADVGLFSRALGHCEDDPAFDWRCDFAAATFRSCVDLGDVGPSSSHNGHAHGSGGSWAQPGPDAEAPEPADPRSTFGIRSVTPSAAGAPATVRVATAAAAASLRVYDVGGRLVRELFRGRLDPGEKSVDWDGRHAAGTAVSSGVNFSRLEPRDAVSTRRAPLLRGCSRL